MTLKRSTFVASLAAAIPALGQQRKDPLVAKLEAADAALPEKDKALVALLRLTGNEIRSKNPKPEDYIAKLAALIDAGANPNTMMAVAVKTGTDDSVIEYMPVLTACVLRAGEDINLRTQMNGVALMLIEKGAGIKMQSQANLAKKDEERDLAFSPLGLAGVYADTLADNPVLAALLKHKDIKDAIDLQDGQGNTALHNAYKIQHKPTIQKLIDAGAEKIIENKAHHTPQENPPTGHKRMLDDRNFVSAASPTP